MVSLSEAPVDASNFWMYASSVVSKRPKGAGHTCVVKVVNPGYHFKGIGKEIYHWRTTVNIDPASFAGGANTPGRGIMLSQVPRNCPLVAADALCRLVQFRCHIKVMHRWLGAVLPIETD